MNSQGETPDKTWCPSGQGGRLEIYWVLPAEVRILSMSFSHPVDAFNQPKKPLRLEWVKDGRPFFTNSPVLTQLVEYLIVVI